MLDSNFKMGKNYPQVFLEECKYVIKEKKIHNDIIDDVEISDFDEGNSDEEILEKIQTKKDSDEKILAKTVLLKKILVKRILMKKTNSFSTRANVIKSYLNIEEIII